VGEPGSVAIFAAGEGADELDDAAEEEQGQRARIAPSWITMVYIFQ
jgi:hypothetical protein